MKHLYKAVCHKTTYTHNQSDQIHQLMFNGLGLALFESANGWYAQGIQINHSSMGSTEKEAIDNFLGTLALTLKAHMDKFGNANSFLVTAPSETISEANKAKLKMSAKITFKYKNFEKELYIFKAPNPPRRQLATASC